MNKWLVIFLLVLAISVQAQTDWHGLKISAPQFDGWSFGHMGGGGLIYGGFRLIGVKPIESLIAVIAGAIFYEFIHDGLQVGYRPDPYGADFIGDVGVTCIGGILIFTVETLLRLDKRLQLYACNNQIGMRIRL